MMPSNRTRQNGNMLFIVLVAIALMGFVTLVLTRSSDTTEDTGSTEQLRIKATEIMRYSGEMQEAFQNLVTRGCSEYQVSFSNSDVTGYTNAKAPSNHSCDIFHRDGAGIKSIMANPAWLDSSQSAQTGYGFWNISNNTCVEEVGTDVVNCGSDSVKNEETILWLGYVSKNMCIELNRIAGVDNPSDAPPVDVGGDSWDSTERYTGTVVEGHKLDTAGTTFSGKKAGCFQKAAGTYVFYQVLMAH